MSPGELVDAGPADAERYVLRARNGLKHLAGVGRPPLDATPKERSGRPRRSSCGATAATAARSAPPLLFVHSLVRRSYVFDLAPGQQLRRVHARPRLRRVPRRLGRARRARGRQHARDLRRRLPAAVVREVADIAGSRRRDVFGYCFGGVLSLLSLAGNPRPAGPQPGGDGDAGRLPRRWGR